MSEIYTVPFGIAVQCHICSKKLESGDECAQLDDDSSTIVCVPCLKKRKQKQPGPTERKYAHATSR